MAIYHLHAQTIGRGSGKSAIAAAAYRSTSRLTDNETGIICDYTRKAKAVQSGILAPEGAPEWVYNREKLWNSVQEKENRKNSQFAWEYDIALPHEERSNLMIYDFCRENFTSKGLICDYAIHKPDKQGDERNLHIHIMVTTRKMTAEGWGEKYRRGENKMNDRREWLNEIRKSWETTCNKHLERLGIKERIDCRTLEAQGINRVPQQHQGPTAAAMERKGKTPDRTRARKPEAEEKERDEEDTLKKLEQEEKALKEKIKLANLSETDFKEELKILQTMPILAQAKAVKTLLPEIEKENESDTKRSKNEINSHKKQRPQGIAPKKNFLTNWLYKWRTDDGKEFSEYEEYAKHQEGLIGAWNKKLKPLAEREKALAVEKKLIEEVKSDEQDPRESINRALKLSREQEQKRPKLFEKIKEKAEELLSKAAEFTMYRNLKNALEEISEARAETARQREQERKQSQEQVRKGRSR